MENRKKPQTLTKRINDFIVEWSRFTIDLWWRKRYSIPFGSPAHRAMNFIDMAIEYQEALLWNKAINQPYEEVVDEEQEAYIDKQLKDSEEKTVKMTQEEIDEDYENLDLDEFDNKE